MELCHLLLDGSCCCCERRQLVAADGQLDNLFDAVEEGALVGAYPGTNPFPCAID